MPDQTDNLPDIDFHPPFAPKPFDISFMVEPVLRKCCGAVFFAQSSKLDSPMVIDNGSFGLVDTGKRKLLVTCRHVWEGFQAELKKDSTVQLCLCLYPGTSIAALDSISLIDQNQELDLATFDADPLLEHLGDSEFSPLCYSSLPRVKRLDALAFIGFPGKVEASNSLGVQFNRVPFVTFAYDVTPLQIVSDMSRMFSYSAQSGEKQPARPRGGISGSPCYVVRSNLSVELVGFAKEEQWDVLRFALASFINSDGTIRKP